MIPGRARASVRRMADTALVTGCSSGMGMHAAVALASAGIDVVATMRDPARDGELRAAAQAAGVTLTVLALDVTDHDAARELVAEVAADHGPVSILVNNAGQGMVGTAEQLGLDAVRAQLEVNYLAPVHLTQLVLPAMRAAGRGRILTVTSVGGVVGQPFADAYCGSKFAVEGFMQSLSTVAHRHGVWVSVVEPAAVASSFVDNAVRADRAGPYEAQLRAYLSRSETAFAAAQSASDAGLAIAEAATSPDYRFRWQTSTGAGAFVAMSLADTDGARVFGATDAWT